jgi:hypothetical protein
MQYLPNLTFWTIGDTAAATRSTLVMEIVLDRSGSMSSDGGMTALKAAVPQFVGDFTNGSDYIGMISFASHSSIDVAISQNFKSAIDSQVSVMSPAGGTFGTAAGKGSVYSTTNGPPMSMADTQLNSIALPGTTPEVKVMVYFTDGLMNTLQDQFMCPNPVVFNYGGYDSGDWVGSLDPASENGGNVWGCYSASGGNGCNTNGIQYDSAGDYCKYNKNYVTTFPSQQTGTQLALNRTNVTAEAKYRAIYTANQMRQEAIPTYVYTIGLGTGVSGDPCTEAFLSSVANDPDGSQYSCPSAPAQYSSSLPAGSFFVVPNCPGSQCTQELQAAFQTIAAKVALRLTQ